MVRRLAELPQVRRALVLGALGAGALVAARWLARDAAPVSSAVTPIHVKYRPGMQQAHDVGAVAARALFSSRSVAHARDDRAAFDERSESTGGGSPAGRAGGGAPRDVDDPRARWVRLEVPASSAHAALDRLARDPAVEQAFIPPTVSLPTEILRDVSQAPVQAAEQPAEQDDRCPIRTPSFESHQGYLGPAPFGIDAPAAWRRGVLGQGVWFADIEGAWNAQHEDLPGDRISHAGGQPIADPSWRAHGTAVLGEVVGRDNGKGVVGIAPEVERVFTSSIGGTSVADAIDTAAESLRAGDVLLIELQGGGPRGRYLPVEYWDDCYDAIEAATRRGVIVIEAAGNGGEDLDHRAYGGKLSREGRDSGAIMIGAGGPPRDGFKDRTRLDFSNYGTRVDVQGWGRMVATLDYGDLQRCAGVDRHYTGQFSGTSSASPIVAGAAILLQSYAKQRGKALSPGQIRSILRETGSPQTGSTKQQIGPRPDLARALPAAGE